jgi:signal transduction histidine kinase
VINFRKSFGGWLPMAGLAVVLMSILAFLFVRSSGYNASAYFENEATIRQLKQLDASWELDVLRSKMGINPNYDSLVDPLADLRALHDKLAEQVASDRHDAATAMTAADQGYDGAIEEKTRLVERFKSHNSVLRNSLTFLPVAAEDVKAASDTYGGVGSWTVSRLASSVLLDTLIYSGGPSEEAAAAIEAQLGRLTATSAALPVSVRDSIGIFVSHARTVLREQPQVDDLLRSIAAVPTSARIDELHSLLSEEQKMVDERIQQDRQYLLIFAAALVALFIFAAVRLIRSHAEINRVNRELSEANANLERRVEERTHDLRSTNTKLSETQKDIRNLLDNSGQGFLSIDAGLLVGGQSSAACETILGEPPAGKSIISLLCAESDHETVAAMTVILESLFRSTQDFARELKIELLPTTFQVGEKTVTVEYKFLADNGRLLLILTDVTPATQLADAVERERKRLEMIVLAVTEGEAFTSMVNDYRKFLTDELPGLIERVETPSAASELRRSLHTYKGLLAQFSFHCSPHCINEAETRFSVATEWTAHKAHEALQPEALRAELDRDLAGAANVLGQDFYSTGRRVLVSQRQLQSMEQVARATLATEEGRSAPPPLRLLLQTLANLSLLDVKAALALHSRSASPLAARLQKQLAEVWVEGDDVSLPPERYADFFRSLVHVFRNAVDHGIETPEEREMAGKPTEGSIRCNVRNLDNSVEITIEDDGGGVNREALEDKLVAAGENGAVVEHLSLADLVFREGLSSRSEATDISGRGVGLAAVKAELDRLGGAASVESKPGAGTRFQFILPIHQQISADTAAAEARRIAS